MLLVLSSISLHAPKLHRALITCMRMCTPNEGWQTDSHSNFKIKLFDSGAGLLTRPLLLIVAPFAMSICRLLLTGLCCLTATAGSLRSADYRCINLNNNH